MIAVHIALLSGFSKHLFIYLFFYNWALLFSHITVPIVPQGDGNRVEKGVNDRFIS